MKYCVKSYCDVVFSAEVVGSTVLDCLFPGVFEEISVLTGILQIVEVSTRGL